MFGPIMSQVIKIPSKLKDTITFRAADQTLQQSLKHEQVDYGIIILLHPIAAAKS